jgi:hypothetical protein
MKQNFQMFYMEFCGCLKHECLQLCLSCMGHLLLPHNRKYSYIPLLVILDIVLLGNYCLLYQALLSLCVPRYGIHYISRHF